MALPEGVRLGLRLALAHHPMCTAFEDDVVQVGSAHVCQGCAAAWPTFTLGLALAAALGLLGPVEPIWLLVTGLLLGLPHIASVLCQPDRKARLTAKLLGGTGLGWATIGWLLVPADPWLKLSGATLVLAAGASLHAWRMLRILRTCKACPFNMDWGRCPGFQEEMAPARGPRSLDAQPTDHVGSADAASDSG